MSWQIVPSHAIEIMTAGEHAGPGYERAFQAMLGMEKLDLAALEAAYRGEQ